MQTQRLRIAIQKKRPPEPRVPRTAEKMRCEIQHHGRALGGSFTEYAD